MIASGAPAWAVWLALSVWTLATVIIVAVILYARATWKRVRPQLSPYLGMLGFGQEQSDLASLVEQYAVIENGGTREDDLS